MFKCILNRNKVFRYISKIYKIFYLIVCWQVGNTLIYILGNVLSEFKNRLQRPNSVDSKVHQKKG